MARDVTVTVVAVCVLVLSGAAVWNVSAYRADQRVESIQQSLGSQPLVEPGKSTPAPTAEGANSGGGAAANASQSSSATAVPPADASTPADDFRAMSAGTTARAKPAQRSSGTRTPNSTTQRQPQTPRDFDGDGIPDAEDRCPTRPETFNGFKDGDGCPDVVETTGAS